MTSTRRPFRRYWQTTSAVRFQTTTEWKRRLGVRALTAMRIVVTALPDLRVAQYRVGAQPPDEGDLILGGCACRRLGAVPPSASGAGAAVVVDLLSCHLTDLRGSCAVGRPRRSWNVIDAAGQSRPDGGVKGAEPKARSEPS